jgi:hypothetical protein
MSKPICPCGQPLHYSDPHLEEMISEMVVNLGEHTTVNCAGRRYKVSRHYIALHGIKGPELEELAAKGIIEKI